MHPLSPLRLKCRAVKNKTGTKDDVLNCTENEKKVHAHNKNRQKCNFFFFALTPK